MVTNGNLGNGEFVSTSILQKAEELPAGCYIFRLSGASYSGNDLPPNDTYKYGVCTIYKRNNTSVIIALYGESAPLAVNRRTSSWNGWQIYVTNTDLSTYYSMDNAIEISKNADLNNYHQFGNYISTAASTTDTLKNCPLTGSGFTMHVERITGSRPDYCKQRIIANNSNAREYWRTKIEGVWQKWYMVVGEQVN